MSVKDKSGCFWEVWGIRTRLTADSLQELIERIRPIAGSIQVSHPITIKSPKGEMWHIPPWAEIEKRSCVPGAYPGVW